MLLRHFVIIIDSSFNLFRPAIPGPNIGPSATHFTTLVSSFKSFPKQYFRLNSYSKLAFILGVNGGAKVVTSLTDSPLTQMKKFKSAFGIANPPSANPAENFFSLQKCLEQAYLMIKLVPRQHTGEILVVTASQSTRDPGNIYDTIEKILDEEIRVSCICMDTASRIYKYIAEVSGGLFFVPQSFDSFIQDLSKFYYPRLQKRSSPSSQTHVLPCAFPEHVNSSTPLFITPNSKTYSSSGFKCPVCGLIHSEIPIECPGCKHTLMHPVKLFHSYQHLFPLPKFISNPDQVYLILLSRDPEALLPIPNLKVDATGSIKSTSSNDLLSLQEEEESEISTVPLRKQFVYSLQMVSCFSCEEYIKFPETDQDLSNSSLESEDTDDSSKKITEISHIYLCSNCKKTFCASCYDIISNVTHICSGCILLHT